MKPVNKPKPKAPSPGYSFVIYGPPGVGKTSLVAEMPKALILCDPQEQSLRDLKRFGQVSKTAKQERVDDWEGLLQRLDDLANDTETQTIGLDSLTGIEALAFDYCCQKDFDGDYSEKGFYSFQRGPAQTAKLYWPEMLDRLETLRLRGKHVPLIAHSQVITFNNPEGPDYDKYTPYLSKPVWQATHRWASAVFFLNYYVEIQAKKGTTKNKATGVTARQLNTTYGATFDAKNRFGLPEVIDTGTTGAEAWAALEAALNDRKAQVSN